MQTVLNNISRFTLNVSICSALVNTQRHMFVHVVAMPGLPVSTPQHLASLSLLSCSTMLYEVDTNSSSLTLSEIHQHFSAHIREGLNTVILYVMCEYG